MSHHDGISLRRFAEQIGVSEGCLLRWCRAGKVVGARKHPLTKKWTIYPPAKLALDAMNGNSLRKLPGYEPTPQRQPLSLDERAARQRQSNPAYLFAKREGQQ
ncbi:hypothetical protein Tbd_1349 [Thiobacillus denitrificans ATCC 25259]|uniref:DNA-binding protein n=1 Tax=Thiobacillus denitrificans (strain ATCC 25259 / T1) TaxID=292415 RepID=Q3SJ65_THIDA|nr:hypothetical protein [Thiobacillus denitrificans]AAZ97302.1 hypothetical protein Tbd_1349 [Thiobacillus denitrificans ATCC 25259]